MLKKSYILNFIIDAKFNIYKIFVISVLGLGDVVFDSVWGGVTPLPPKETLLEVRGGNFFTA